MARCQRPVRRRRAAQADVARMVGVSQTTVSNAFIRPERLSAELRIRIREAAEELQCRGPDPSARGLRTGRIGALGVVFAERAGSAVRALRSAAVDGFLISSTPSDVDPAPEERRAGG